MRPEIAQEHLHIASCAHDLVDLIQSLCPVPGCQGIRELEQHAAVRSAQRLAHELFRQFLAGSHAGIQQAPCIAHAAVRRTRNQLKCTGLGFRQFRDRRLHAVDHLFLCQATEIETLAAAEDRGWQFLGLGRREDEDHIGRRLFQRLQQCVEGCIGEHVHFVDDIYFVLAVLRRVFHFFEQVADLLHAAVAGRVHLKDVKGCILHQRAAALALHAGIAVHRMQAVDGPRHDLGRARLACTMASAEQIGMGDPAAGHLMPQRTDNRFLAHHLRKSTRTPFPIQRLIHPIAASFIMQCKYKKQTVTGYIIVYSHLPFKGYLWYTAKK